ncbi:hypothetical protein [Corynebacterium aquilae]|uniref:Uncharacterized protein n=1 Tax=Corynebacterium aquilae DSM 44791 TaxID=1431546 RepID=A0A1L7CHJ1_9CORY|nr:hypothetical protein [Corynebacterium aquilae]APT85314.1 hypothetical protein CAQU_09810 [Corynebacterium aquilae DSM 44791]
MTSPLKQFQDSMPWSVIMKPRTENTALIGGTESDVYVNLPAGVSTVAITWNGSTNLSIYHRPNRNVRPAAVSSIPNASFMQPKRQVLTLASEDSRGTLHFGTVANPQEVADGNVFALVQIFPTPIKEA